MGVAIRLSSQLQGGPRPRDGVEALLCGIPRAALEATSDADHVVCPECIDWLPKGTRFSE